MILDAQNLSYILGISGLGGIIFTIYDHFKNPQESLEKRQEVSEEEIKGKDELLAQKIEWEKQLMDKRFVDMGERFTENTTITQNHMRIVDMKVETLTNVINTMNLHLNNQIVRLKTIIEERLPKNE
jgi:hypothetical protein